MKMQILYFVAVFAKKDSKARSQRHCRPPDVRIVLVPWSICEYSSLASMFRQPYFKAFFSHRRLLNFWLRIQIQGLVEELERTDKGREAAASSQVSSDSVASSCLTLLFIE
jgi:hypothetical protein